MQSGPLPFELAYLAMPVEELPDRYRYAEDAAPMDKIAMECAWAVERDAGTYQAWNLTEFLGRYESPIVLDLYERFSREAAVDLRLTGRLGQLLLRRPGAWARLVNDLPELARARRAGSINMVILGIEDMSDGTVRAMGQIAATGYEKRDQYLDGVLAAKLADAHTKAALPALFGYLNHPKSDVRRQAVRGITLYMGDYPPATRENVSSGRSLKSRGAAPEFTEDVRPNLHIGEFKSAEDEARILGFWKAWWAANRNRIQP